MFNSRAGQRKMQDEFGTSNAIHRQGRKCSKKKKKKEWDEI
jgi:hypothetical protein